MKAGEGNEITTALSWLKATRPRAPLVFFPSGADELVDADRPVATLSNGHVADKRGPPAVLRVSSSPDRRDFGHWGLGGGSP